MKRTASDRGGVYVLVLTTSATAAAIALIGLNAVSTVRARGQLANDRRHAQRLAESGMNVALAAVSESSAWRSNGGALVGATQMNGGRFMVTATEADDSVITLLSTGEYGDARQRVSLQCTRSQNPVEALEHPIVTAGAITGLATIVETVSGKAVTRVNSVADAEIRSTATNLEMVKIAMPDPSVVRQYADRGTRIELSASDANAGVYYRGMQLSSTTAPTGTPVDPDGIYVLDAGGGYAFISDLQLIGTLVVTNAQYVVLEDTQVMRVGPEGYPLLVTDVPTTLIRTASYHSSTRVADTDDLSTGPDFDDSNFNGWQGIVYINNSLWIQDGLDLHGTLMATGTITLSGTTSITRNDAFLEAPPPGFTDGSGDSILPVAGSWRHVVD